jgi:hypothetical protein
MKPAIFLRIASVLTFIHGVLHTIGGVFATPAPGAQQAAVAAMKENQFLVMGFTRSYWHFYQGFSIGASISLIVNAVVFWQLSSLAKTSSLRLRPIYGAFVASYLLLALNSYQYFFPPPVITEILIALFLGLALYTSSPSAVPSTSPDKARKPTQQAQIG